MRRYLKEDLEVKAPIVGTIVANSTPNLMARMDAVDTHSYWQHPRFPGRPWDSNNWTVKNVSMVNDKGGGVAGLALQRVAGKPHLCTEYNHSAQNTYSSEAPLLLAAVAALQDSDGLFPLGRRFRIFLIVWLLLFFARRSGLVGILFGFGLVVFVRFGF